MRVIAGSARSIPLISPKGLSTRPTSDRIKETLFNIINPYMYDGDFIDVFAGSGAIGIEALSRGVSGCYLMDNSRVAIACIKRNLEVAKLEEGAIVLQGDSVALLKRIDSIRAGIVFVDPPYSKGLEQSVLQVLSEAEYVNDDTTIIIEMEINQDISYIHGLGFCVIREKLYKSNKHVFARRA